MLCRSAHMLCWTAAPLQTAVLYSNSKRKSRELLSSFMNGEDNLLIDNSSYWTNTDSLSYSICAFFALQFS